MINKEYHLVAKVESLRMHHIIYIVLVPDSQICSEDLKFVFHDYL